MVILFLNANRKERQLEMTVISKCTAFSSASSSVRNEIPLLIRSATTITPFKQPKTHQSLSFHFSFHDLLLPFVYIYLIEETPIDKLLLDEICEISICIAKTMYTENEKLYNKHEQSQKAKSWELARIYRFYKSLQV